MVDISATDAFTLDDTGAGLSAAIGGTDAAGVLDAAGGIALPVADAAVLTEVSPSLALAVLDSTVLAEGPALAVTLSALDVLALQESASPGPLASDGGTLVELAGLGPNATDAAALTEGTGSLTASLGQTDVVSFGEAVALALPAADTFALVDVVSGIAPAATDAFTLLEVVLGLTVLALPEAIALFDASVSLTAGVAGTESALFGESVGLALPATDALTLADAGVALAPAATDAFVLTDMPALALGVQDSASWAEAASQAVAVAGHDTAGLVDIPALLAAPMAVDAASLAEGVASLALGQTDTLTLAESTPVLLASVTTTDVLACTDAAALSVLLTARDALLLADAGSVLITVIVPPTGPLRRLTLKWAPGKPLSLTWS